MTVPGMHVPAGACDCHVHVFGPLNRYPVGSNTPYAVPDLGTADLIRLMDAAGVHRAVIVHAATSGRDNLRTLDALREFPDRFRGVIVPPLEPPDDDALSDWDAMGVRGIRFSYTHTAQPGMEIDTRLLSRVAPLGWHAQVHLEAQHLPLLESTIGDLDVPVVLDHMGRIPSQGGLESTALASVLRLLDKGHVWIKLSAPMRLSSHGRYPYPDVAPLAKALAQAAPHRILWGSDWPHVNLSSAAPRYEDLLKLVGEWLTDDTAIQRLLVDNPRELYRFPPTP